MSADRVVGRIGDRGYAGRPGKGQIFTTIDALAKVMPLATGERADRDARLRKLEEEVADLAQLNARLAERVRVLEQMARR